MRRVLAWLRQPLVQPVQVRIMRTSSSPPQLGLIIIPGAQSLVSPDEWALFEQVQLGLWTAEESPHAS